MQDAIKSGLVIKKAAWDDILQDGKNDNLVYLEDVMAIRWTKMNSILKCFVRSYRKSNKHKKCFQLFLKVAKNLNLVGSRISS